MAALDQKQMYYFILITHQPDMDKVSLYVRDPYEVKYPLLISKCESADRKDFDKPKAFIEYCYDIVDIYGC